MRISRIAWSCLLLATLVLVGPGPVAASAAGVGPAERHVLAISVDGLNPAALGRLGRDRAPTLHRMMDEGAFTLNARTQVESTETLPNHTSMVTGRRVLATRGGHGVTWNVHRPRTTVQAAADQPVGSVFSVAHEAGSTALFATKRKLSIFERSWDADIDRVGIWEGNDVGVMRAARADLLQVGRDLTFVHFGRPDVVGHARGFLSPAYLDAVQRIDSLLASLLRAVDTDPALANTVVIVTADHGGPPGGSHHDNAASYANYRVPFFVWGSGVTPGDLYAMNPAYADPGHRRVPYSGQQPIRNGDLANLALDLLGLGPVPDSLFDARQRLSPGMPLRTSVEQPRLWRSECGIDAVEEAAH